MPLLFDTLLPVIMRTACHDSRYSRVFTAGKCIYLEFNWFLLLVNVFILNLLEYICASPYCLTLRYASSRGRPVMPAGLHAFSLLANAFILNLFQYIYASPYCLILRCAFSWRRPVTTADLRGLLLLVNAFTLNIFEYIYASPYCMTLRPSWRAVMTRRSSRVRCPCHDGPSWRASLQGDSPSSSSWRAVMTHCQLSASIFSHIF